MSKTTAPIVALLCAALCLPTTAAWAAPPPSPPGGVQPGGADPTAGMSEEQKLERAKQLYGEADGMFQQGNFADALAKFEEAYNVYAPNFHVFNFNIGLSAYELGDCAKAKTAFQRFLDLVAEHPSRGEAQQKLIEIERSGCAASVAPTPVDTGTTAPVPEDEDDSPLLTSKKDEREDAIERERSARDSKKQHPLVIAGAVITAAGGAALIGSGVSLILANQKANSLADLASPGPTGFPGGDYSDDEIFQKDRARAPGGLPFNNGMTIGLLVGGVVLAGVGIGLLVVGIKRKKAERGGKGKNALAPQQQRHLTIAPSYLPRGGGAAATMRF